MLRTFLTDLACRDFRWGETDCAIILADWWMLNHPDAADPAADIRGRYRGISECDSLLAANGHLPRLVARLARRACAQRTYDPQPGDFAVIRVARRWYGAIRTPSGRWAIKGGPGLTVLSECRVVAAWGI